MANKFRCGAGLVFLAIVWPASADDGRSPDYWICVSNEKAGSVSILDGKSHKTVATVPVGKRPRGIHPSPDGRLLYVAVSGSPITGPPKLDARGNPIFAEEREEDADRSADGIAVVDLVQRKFLRKLPSGVDPEEFAVSRDGRQLYISNEDVGTVSVVNVDTGMVEHIIRVKKEPEGVALSPDGKFIYVTCETGGEVFVIDTGTNKTVAEIQVGGRPRSVAFSPDGALAFIPSETAGTITTVDTKTRKVLRAIKLPEGSRPMGTAMAADGTCLWVSTGRGGTVCALEPANGKLLHKIPVGKRPWGIRFSPDGKLLHVANGPSDDVSLIDVAQAKEIGRIKTGQGPWGIAIVPALK
jgi:YVTN family beta-propeller protein